MTTMTGGVGMWPVERTTAMKRWMRIALVVVLGLFGFWLGWAHAQDGNAKTERKTLDQARDVEGIPCAKGYAWFYVDGKLERCTVSREIGFGVAQVQRESIVALLPDGRPDYVMMRSDAAIGEVECRGGNWLLGPSEGAMTTFYPSGKLKQCWLAGDQVVQGVPCMSGAISGDGAKRDGGARFKESGKLESCTLGKEYAGMKRGERWVVK